MTVTKQTAMIANKKIFFDNAKIMNALKYQFIPIERSVKDTADAFNREKKEGRYFPLSF